MPQARLPDINTAFTKHRNEAMSSLKSGNYDSVFGSLYALNALLPDIIDEDTKQPKYRVIISDIEYNKKAKPTIYVYCYHCDKDNKEGHLYEQVKFFDLLLPFVEQQLIQVQTTKAWKCPNCNKVNKLARTRKEDKIAETQLKEPFYLGVVPKPPARHDGLMDRTRYHNKMIQWSLTMLDELEAKMAQFRDDNWSKGDEENEGADLAIDGGETE